MKRGFKKMKTKGKQKMLKKEKENKIEPCQKKEKQKK